MATPLRFEARTEDFFKIPPAKIEIETVPATGRTYFLYKGRIVAVAVHP